MDLFANLWLGMSVVLTPTNVMFLMIGAMIGMLVGIIPGFGPSAGIAILMPLTFGMDPIAAGQLIRLLSRITDEVWTVSA